MSGGLVEDKARALLVSGAVTVTSVDDWGIDAVVEGFTGRYRTSWAPAPGWRCTCPETRGACSHILAVVRVTGLRGARS